MPRCLPRATAARCPARVRAAVGRLATLLLLAAALLVHLPAGRAGEDTDQFQFAEGLFIRADYESAIEEYQKVITKFAQSPSAATARYRLGESYFRLKRYPAAATAYSAALAAAPAAPEAPLGSYNLGRSYLLTNEFAKAADAFALAAAKGNAEVKEEALIGRGECLIKLSKLDDAAATYDEFLKAFPQSKRRPEVLFSLGWVNHGRQQYEAAIVPLKELLAAQPDGADAAKARLLLSDANVALTHYDAAVALLTPLLQVPAYAQEALLRLAWVKFKSGDKAGAITTFTQFADQYKDAPARPAALYNAGIAAYDLQQFPQAVTVFERLLADHAASPEAKDARFWLGLSYSETGAKDKAITTLEPVLKDDALKPALRAAARYSYAAALAASTRTQDAAAQFRTLITEKPDAPNLPNAYYALATAQQQLNDLPGAIASLSALLEKFPQTTLRAPALFALGEYHYRLQQPERALPYLLELTKPDVAPTNALYRLGWVHFDLKHFADSRTVFLRLAALKSEFQAEARFMAARAAEEAADTAAATKDYQAIAALQPDDAYAEKALHRLGYLLPVDAAAANLAEYAKRFPQGAQLAPLKLRLAERYFEQGQWAPAAEQYRALLTLPALPADLHRAADYGLGWCLLKLNQPVEADAQFAKVGDAPLDLPLVQDALLQRGEIAYQREQYAAALPPFTKLAALSTPVAERALYMQGWCQRRLNAKDQSIPCFRALLERFPKGKFAVDAGLRLAEALAAKPDYAEARKVLDTVRAQVPAEREEEFLQLVSDLQVAQEDWAGVLETCKTLAEKYPQSKSAYLVSFRRGLAHKAAGVYDDAEKDFRETMAKTDTVEAAQAQFNIGTLYYSRKDYPEAAKQFLRAEMLYDYPALAPKALYHAVDAFYQAGDEFKPRAAAYLKELHDKYPQSEWTTKADKLAGPPPAAPAKDAK